MGLYEASGAIVIFAVILILAWDLFAFLFGGWRVTVSRVVQQWVYSSSPLVWIMLGMVIGGLLVHFTGWAPGPAEGNCP